MDVSTLPLTADPAVLAAAARRTAELSWPAVIPGPSVGVRPELRATCDDEPLVDIDRLPAVTTVPAYSLCQLPGSVTRMQLRAGAAGALVTAARRLPDGFTLVALDAWRAPRLQRHLATDPEAVAGGYVAPPSDDPACAPPHTTGGTVDVTLAFNGVPLALGTGYDDFSRRAHLTALDGAAGPDGHADRLRRLLTAVMCGAGFVAYSTEWWHFELGTRRWAEVTGKLPRYRRVTVEPTDVPCSTGSADPAVRQESP